MKDDKKTQNKEWLPVRIFFAIVLFVCIWAMFISKPDGAGSLIDMEFMWDAVHPYSPLWDTLGIACLLFDLLFLAGLATPVYKLIQPQGEGSVGAFPAIAMGCGIGMIVFFFLL